jgi:hypothetical protein
MHAVARQWEHVADALDAWDEDAIRVRMAVEQLTTEIDRAESNFEFIADLLAVVAAEDRFLNLALMWKEAVEQGSEDAFWKEHEDEAIHVFGVKTTLAADMRERGELTANGRVLLPDEDVED